MKTVLISQKWDGRALLTGWIGTRPRESDRQNRSAAAGLARVANHSARAIPSLRQSRTLEAFGLAIMIGVAVATALGGWLFLVFHAV